jgi:predicted nucleic acid-binding protein
MTTAGTPILLDTNILLRLGGAEHPQHEKAVAAIDILHRSNLKPVLVPQVLYEYWVVATRPLEVNGLGMSVDDADRTAAAWTTQFRLLGDERGIFPRWRTLVVTYQVQGKPAHDARLVAAMLRHGVTHLLTFNTADFKRFEYIVAVSPDDVAAGSVSA